MSRGLAIGEEVLIVRDIVGKTLESDCAAFGIVEGRNGPYYLISLPYETDPQDCIMQEVHPIQIIRATKLAKLLYR